MKNGLPHGDILIKHHNFAETKVYAKAGVLHGKVVMKNKNGAPTFIGILPSMGLNYSNYLNIRIVRTK